ncbi:MAG: molybdopterin-dependent oxidoreductase [Pseudomonadota bacterium]|nr:molybdopterin-dependent oxidoreductase [Pseudomonadota bacterium]
MWFSDENNVEVEQDDTNAPPAFLDFLTVTCQQCERPACLRACPVNPKAISKDPDTGVVAINENRCTGCGECATACPYGAIGYNAEDHHAVKCDLCAHRREDGNGPACASVCPTKAIQFGKVEDHLAYAAENDREVLDNDHFLQKPSTVYLKRKADQGLSQADHAARHANQAPPKLLTDHKVRRNLTSEETLHTYQKADREVLDRAEVTTVPGGCNICFNGCPIKFEMRDGQVTNIFGNEASPIFQGRVCPKSQMTLQTYHSKQRLLTPLKRVGERGEGKFKPISWDQALDEITANLKDIRAKHGADTLAIQAGSRTGVLNLMGAIPLFGNLWGTNNIATTEPFCDLGKIVALEATQGSTLLANTYTPEDIGSAQLYVYFGDNQAETRPVNFGLLNDWRLKNNARMVVVDPRMTATAAKADEWLAIRPGTDMALGLALIHEILTAGLYEQDFCDNWMVGFEEWRDFILDQQYSPEWAAPITDIPAQSIQKLAREIAEADGAMLMLSRGVNQHTNSAQTNRTFMFLAAITGNYGRQGGGFFNVSSEPDWQTPKIPAERTPDRRPAISKNPAAWVDAMLGDDIYPIKALITGNNPMGQWPDLNKSRRALKNLDLVVHMDLYQNATSDYSDYVLPIATGIEKGGTTRFAEDRRIVWNDRLIDPPGEAKSDHWVWIELGKRLGFEDILKDEFKDPRKLWDDVVRPSTPDIQGITIQRLLSKPDRCIRIPMRTEDASEIDTLYLEGSTASGFPQGTRFPTKSGKLEFYTDDLIAKFGDMGFSPLPEFYSEEASTIPLPHVTSDTENVVSPFFHNATYAKSGGIQPSEKAALPAQGFDTELVTGRPPAPHFHSWTHYMWQAQEMWPELFCQIHPSKADALSIKDGDKVRVSTEYGEITVRAWRHSGIRKSAIFIPIGWDERQPFHPEKSVNHLTGLKLDPISQQPNLKLTLCKVEKY